MKTVTHKELSNISMVGGKENKYNIVIHEGKLIQWVAIGWIEIGTVKPDDYKKYPVLVN